MADVGVVKVEGLKELMRKLSPELVAAPMRDFFNRAAIEVEGAVKVVTPVDTGRLRASVTHRIEGTPITTRAIVGTNVAYAPYVEYGTRPHFPPVGAVSLWARHHGIPAFALARAIAARGTQGRHMFREGLRTSIGAINGYVQQLARDIEARWRR